MGWFDPYMQCAYIESAGLAFLSYWTSVMSLWLEPAKASLLALCKCGVSCANCIHPVMLLLLSTWNLLLSLPLSHISYPPKPLFTTCCYVMFPGSDCSRENGCTVVLGPVWRNCSTLNKNWSGSQLTRGSRDAVRRVWEAQSWCSREGQRRSDDSRLWWVGLRDNGKERRPVGRSLGQKPFHPPEDHLYASGAGNFALQCRGGYMVRSDPGI